MVLHLILSESLKRVLEKGFQGLEADYQDPLCSGRV